MRIIQEGALSLQLLVREFCECKVPHARCSKNVKNAHLGLYYLEYKMVPSSTEKM